MNRPDSFSPLRFRQYAQDLSKAVHRLGRESQQVTTVVKIKQAMQPIDYAPQRYSFMSDALPTVDIVPAEPVAKPAASGSFAASLKAIVDEAKAGIEQAKANGLAQVRDAVGDLTKAKDATIRVTDNMASTVKSQAADIMAELGQISNDLG